MILMILINPNQIISALIKLADLTTISINGLAFRPFTP